MSRAGRRILTAAQKAAKVERQRRRRGSGSKRTPTRNLSVEKLKTGKHRVVEVHPVSGKKIGLTRGTSLKQAKQDLSDTKKMTAKVRAAKTRANKTGKAQPYPKTPREVREGKQVKKSTGTKSAAKGKAQRKVNAGIKKSKRTQPKGRSVASARKAALARTAAHTEAGRRRMGMTDRRKHKRR